MNVGNEDGTISLVDIPDAINPATGVLKSLYVPRFSALNAAKMDFCPFPEDGWIWYAQDIYNYLSSINPSGVIFIVCEIDDQELGMESPLQFKNCYEIKFPYVEDFVYADLHGRYVAVSTDGSIVICIDYTDFSMILYKDELNIFCDNVKMWPYGLVDYISECENEYSREFFVKLMNIYKR